MVRFKNSCDLSGSPYWETEDDLFPPTPDLDKDPDSTWLIWMRIDYEERELERRLAEDEIEQGEEDALIKAWGGEQPKHLSMRRQTKKRS